VIAPYVPPQREQEPPVLSGRAPMGKKFSPPPLHERVKAITAGLLLMGCVAGAGTTHDRQWLATFAVAAVCFLFTAMYYPFKSMDKREDDEDADGV
jgi:hypothetical protein